MTIRQCNVCGRKDWPEGTLLDYADICNRCFQVANDVVTEIACNEGLHGAGRRLGLLPKQQPLTVTERLVYDHILSWIYYEGRSPSFEELKRRLEWPSKSKVARNVNILTDKGWPWPRDPRARYALQPVDDEWVSERAENTFEITDHGLEAISHLRAVK